MSFIEEYKKLDNLCKDLFNSDKGVTEYINALEEKGVNYLSKSDKDDYYKLKHYRHIRNEIAHDVGKNEKNMCTELDVIWIKQFYKRILNTSDPLASRTKKVHMKTYKKKANYGKKKKRRNKIGAFLLTIILILLALYGVNFLLSYLLVSGLK